MKNKLEELRDKIAATIKVSLSIPYIEEETWEKMSKSLATDIVYEIVRPEIELSRRVELNTVAEKLESMDFVWGAEMRDFIKSLKRGDVE